VNRGAGRTKRTVVAIGDFECQWLGDERNVPKEQVVKYLQKGKEEEERLYLSSFASWAGKVLK
jgi:hypothetical protein